MGIHAQFRLANRAEIEGEIERLITLLDGTDGDPDLEAEDDYCLAGDDGCGVARSIAGGVAWGSPDEAGGWVVPRYGIDQTMPPLNTREAERGHYRRMMIS